MRVKRYCGHHFGATGRGLWPSSSGFEGAVFPPAITNIHGRSTLGGVLCLLKALQVRPSCVWFVGCILWGVPAGLQLGCPTRVEFPALDFGRRIYVKRRQPLFPRLHRPVRPTYLAGGSMRRDPGCRHRLPDAWMGGECIVEIRVNTLHFQGGRANHALTYREEYVGTTETKAEMLPTACGLAKTTETGRPKKGNRMAGTSTGPASWGR